MGALPKPPVEVPVHRALADLAPVFAAKVELVIADMAAWGFDAWVFETLRTNERQRFLHGFGRQYDDGRGVVTHSATSEDTWHGYGLAADIVSRSQLWNADRWFWDTLGLSARRHGLLWGADWNNNGRTDDERFQDRPHIQWGAPMRRSPSSRAGELLRTQGIEGVWREVGAL